MPRALLQLGGAGAVVDGQGNADFGNVHVAHNAVGFHGKGIVVLLQLGISELPVGAVFRQLFVVGVGGVQIALGFPGIHGGDLRRVGGDGLGLVKGVVPVT